MEMSYVSQAQSAFACHELGSIFQLEVGHVYTGKMDLIMNFG